MSQPTSTTKNSVYGQGNRHSSNPVWDFFSSIIRKITSLICCLFTIIFSPLQFILNALSKFKIIQNCLYVLNGKCENDPKHLHPSIKSIEKGKNRIYMYLLGMIVTGLFYSILMYTNIYIYKNFLDAFGSGDSQLFNKVLIEYTWLTVLLVVVRAFNKYIRKTTQSRITKEIRTQWIDLMFSVNLNALQQQLESTPSSNNEQEQKNKKSCEIGQIVQQEVEDTVSYAVVTMTQFVYMTCDAIFFSYFLINLAPNLMLLAIATATVCSIAVYIPGAKQLAFQKKSRTLESEVRIGSNTVVAGKTYQLDCKETQSDGAKRLVNDSDGVYRYKVLWETLYSGITRLISFLSTPAALVLVAPGFNSGVITFGVVMASLRCFKDFLDSIMLVNDNRKMFNKFETGVTRLENTAKQLYKQKDHEQKVVEKHYERSKTNTYTIPSMTLRLGSSHQIEINNSLKLKPGIHLVRGKSGSGKSTLCTLVNGTLLQNQNCKINSVKKIQTPYEINDRSAIFYQSQFFRDTKLIKKNFTASDLISATWRKLKGFKLITEDLITENRLNIPFEQLSGGEKDRVGLICIINILNSYKENPNELPIKTLILDEMDQGLGSMTKDVYSKLSKLLEPFQSLITIISSHNIFENGELRESCSNLKPKSYLTFRPSDCSQKPVNNEVTQASIVTITQEQASYA